MSRIPRKSISRGYIFGFFSFIFTLKVCSSPTIWTSSSSSAQEELFQMTPLYALLVQRFPTLFYICKKKDMNFDWLNLDANEHA